MLKHALVPRHRKLYKLKQSISASGRRVLGDTGSIKAGSYEALISNGCRHRSVATGPASRICIGKRKINLSQVFSGQLVGIREVEEKIWLVSFLDFDLGYFDEKEGRVEPGPNPFEAKVLTMPPN